MFCEGEHGRLMSRSNHCSVLGCIAAQKERQIEEFGRQCFVGKKMGD